MVCVEDQANVYPVNSQGTFIICGEDQVNVHSVNSQERFPVYSEDPAEIYPVNSTLIRNPEVDIFLFQEYLETKIILLPILLPSTKKSLMLI